MRHKICSRAGGLLVFSALILLGGAQAQVPQGGNTPARPEGEVRAALDIQAHRGGRGLMPENTIPAMLNAVRLGARTLELDCIISADGKVVVSHDPFMNADILLKPDGTEIPKPEEKQYVLYRMTYDSIRKFAEGVKPYPQFPQQARVRTYKPLLNDLIDSVEDYVKQHHLKPLYYNIETKCSPQGDGVLHPAPGPFVDLLMGVIRSKGIRERVIIQSFDPRTLQIIHKAYPDQVTALLIGNRKTFEEDIADLGFTPAIYSPYYPLVNADLVKKAHAAKVAVLPWTVNDEPTMQALAEMGVDGIISDYPDKLVKLFGSFQPPGK